ncbi:MurR/RpiR family transcriptional regulator [Roseicella frigidaeris]|uniref:MurR/RpiR family transcriptional regulator n=1 Tax=Roseicella frigidaeris TaxID=2230885 RepID=A0A327M7E6_9PROT|nr:MurR/RpiR family transcriptional regulator [Roseicella frigidaeris]RAI59231.1 MurR/RpiR family transcriptional regulator [Roseicella frigidaeris]
MVEDQPIAALRRALPGLPPRLQAAARFVARHDFDAATRSMRELAAAAGASPATFTRLAQALGYAGWDGLRAALIETRRPPATPFSRRVSPASAPPTAADIPARLLEADAASLGGLEAAPIAAAAGALHAAPRIWVAGFRSCRGIAQLLHYQLRLFRPADIALVGGAGPEDLDLGALAAGDAMVVIGFAPYSRQSLRAARVALEAGCRLVVLADAPAAPIAEGAEHLLLFEAAAGPGFFPSLTGALATAQALAAACFALGGEPALARLRATEARLAALAEYLPDPETSS